MTEHSISIQHSDGLSFKGYTAASFLSGVWAKFVMMIATDRTFAASNDLDSRTLQDIGMTSAVRHGFSIRAGD